MYKKVAVVGGGVFGCTAAWMLAKNGCEVDLFEKNSDIFSQASGINQYRLHQGYHYPRSIETALASIHGQKTFFEAYPDAVVDKGINHYYSISRKESKVSGDQYLDFLNAVGLEYELTNLTVVKDKEIDLTILAKEYLFNPKLLKKANLKLLNKHEVNINFNKNVFIDDLEKYDFIVNATYSNYNALTPVAKQFDLQFELCEKPILKLPDCYAGLSVVIMDGPFMCIDPYPGTPFHVMGNVVHAIHERSYGKFKAHNKQLDSYLNKGVINNPEITNIDLFLESAATFFEDIKTAKHIGSMYTHRTVLPLNESDDARPTLVTKVDDRVYNIFSGKIGTCVDAALDLVEISLAT